MTGRQKPDLLTHVSGNLYLESVIYLCMLTEDSIGEDLHVGREGGWRADLAAELPVDYAVAGPADTTCQ